MLHELLHANRADLLARCQAKVAERSSPRATAKEMEGGIPLFLGHLIETLGVEQGLAPSDKANGRSRSAGRDMPSEISAGATRHGRDLLRRGFTVDQVVHEYGDLCQAIFEVAVEKDAPVSNEEAKTLNACLDNAIADAVTEFGSQRERLASEKDNRVVSERLGSLAHEMRNLLNTAMLSFTAIKGGGVGLQGATSTVLERSLVGLRDIINDTLADVRLAAGVPLNLEDIAVDRFIAEVQLAASLEARVKQCEFTVTPVERGLATRGDKQMLYSAVSNLLQNAFKFTHEHSAVSLQAYGKGARVLIEVADHCGGLPEGKAEAMFLSFEQHHGDRSGLGLGLSIARRGVEACGGLLTVRDIPGTGCVFAIDLPRQAPASTPAV